MVVHSPFVVEVHLKELCYHSNNEVYGVHAVDRFM